MTYFRSIMPSPEARAIVRATAPAVHSDKAALRFRLWHHLAEECARRCLFEEFVVGEQRLDVVEALIECGEQRNPHAAPRLARQLPPAELARLHHALKPALRKALGEVLGTTSNKAVLNAWDETFVYLLAPATA